MLEMINLNETSQNEIQKELNNQNILIQQILNELETFKNKVFNFLMCEMIRYYFIKMIFI